MKGRKLEGCRVLVVEDEMLIALVIEDALVDLGCEIVGPAGKLETAMQLATEEQIDIALLDVTLRGDKVYPLAEQLVARGIPFAFASGYGDWALPEALRDCPRLMKPFTVLALEDQVRALCANVQSDT
jgi:two-component SAPR family response regulator